MADVRALANTAQMQHGVFSAAQAAASGLSREALRKRVSRGSLHLDCPGVFAIPGVPRTWRRGLMGACLWAGPGTAASFRSAARLWGLPRFDEDLIEISTVSRLRPHGLPFRVHRVNRFLLEELELVDGIPVTSVRRTLLDLCGERRERRAERGLDHALFNNLVTLGQLWLLYDEEWTRGRRGIAILRSHLMQRTQEKGPSDGDCARLFWGIVGRCGLPQPEVQYPVRLPSGITIHVDFAYPGSKVAIETDGYAFHNDRRAFENDRERDAQLSSIGWRPLRFSWAKLRFAPEFVSGAVLAHIPAPSPAPSG